MINDGVFLFTSRDIQIVGPLTVLRFGPQFLHGRHAVDHDATGQIRQAGGLLIDHYNVPQSGNILQNGLTEREREEHTIRQIYF